MATKTDCTTILHICEATARGIDINFNAICEIDNTSPEDCEKYYRDTFTKVVGTIKTLKLQAHSTTWSAEFVNKIDGAITMKKRIMSHTDKEFVRNFTGACMACNRRECQNDSIVDIFGYSESAWTKSCHKPFTSYDHLREDTKKYIKAYNDVIVGGDDMRVGKRGVHPQDGGFLVLGKTCTNRLLTAFMLNTFIFENIYNAMTYIDERIEAGHRISKKCLYVNEEMDMSIMRASFEAMQLLVASHGNAVPEAVPSDPSYWRSAFAIRRRYPQCRGNGTTTFLRFLGFLGANGWPSSARSIDDSSSSGEEHSLSNGDDSGAPPESRKRPREQLDDDSAAPPDSQLDDDSAAPPDSRKEAGPDKPADVVERLLSRKDELVKQGKFEVAVMLCEEIIQELMAVREPPHP